MPKTTIRGLVASGAVLIALSGCGESPAEQCLDSFKTTLKDPNSGQVISFENNLLTYTATNSYGGRVQGKAMCTQQDDKWVRDLAREDLRIKELSLKMLQAYNTKLDSQVACLRAGGNMEKCTSNPRLDPNDAKDLDEKAAQELGFK